MSDDKCIRVWRFDDAPDEFRAMSQHGGDEDWVAHIPAGFDGGEQDDEDGDPIPPYVSWADDGTPFGCCDVDTIRQSDGSWVFIGAHA